MGAGENTSNGTVGGEAGGIDGGGQDWRRVEALLPATAS
jgi:hypothetical protein